VQATESALRAARRSARLLERLFEHTLSQRQPVILHADHADFQQTTVIPGLIPQGIGGVTEGRRGRTVVPLWFVEGMSWA
jgi:hypothetical protein